MIGIIFYLEDIDDRFNPEMIDQWMFDAKALGVTDVFMIDKTKYKMGQYYQNGDSEINLHWYASFHQVIQNHPDISLVYLENKKSFEALGYIYQDLYDHIHKEECIYVFGPDSGIEITLSFTNSTMPGYVNIQNVDNIYAHAAMIITLYHRLNQ